MYRFAEYQNSTLPIQAIKSMKSTMKNILSILDDIQRTDSDTFYNCGKVVNTFFP